tara:strand:+ start:9755 stop:10669 length:915 start_codon:yes stop_codon:yes gene_type:complete
MSNYTGIPEDDKVKLDQDLNFAPSTLETVDYSIYDYINDALDLKTLTNEGRKKVPVIWASAERAFQIKNSKEYRDNEGLIILPAITIERKNVDKSPTRKGAYYGGMFPISTQPEKGGSVVISRRIKQDKTSNFANADAKRRYNDTAAPNFVRKATEKVVYETISIPALVHVSVNYDIKIRTEYQQQMNDLLQPFITRPGFINSFVVHRDGHRYEAFVSSNFTSQNNLDSMENEERKYETTVQIEVLAYLVGEGDNQKTPKFSIRENAVQVRIGREHTVWDDQIVTGGPPEDDKKNFGVDGKYRE